MVFKILAPLLVYVFHSVAVDAQGNETGKQPGFEKFSCDVQFSSFNYYRNPRGICSGHGICNQTTRRCDCDPGYTGLSDWINTDGLDCQLDLNAVKVLWGFNTFLAVAIQIMVAPKMYSRFQDFRERQKMFQMHGKKYPLTENRSLLAILFYEFWVLPGLLICTLVKFHSPSERVGVTFTMTFMFAFVKIGFYFGVAYQFQPSLIKTLLSSGSLHRNKEVQRLIIKSNRFAKFNLVASLSLSMVPFLSLIQGGRLGALAETAWLLYLLGMIVSMVAYFFQAIYLKHKVSIVLMSAAEHAGGSKNDGADDSSSHMLKTRRMIVKLQHQIIFQTVFQCFLYSLFLFWPYLWNKHDYFLPLSWIAFILIGKDLAETHVTTKASRRRLQDLRVSFALMKTFMSSARSRIPDPRKVRSLLGSDVAGTGNEKIALESFYGEQYSRYRQASDASRYVSEGAFSGLSV